MDASSIRLSTILTIGTGTALTAMVAYAIYFDHRRRNDPEFRKSLKREQKLLAKAEREKKVAAAEKQKQIIEEAVRQANLEGYPTDELSKEAFFMDQLQLGETYTKQGQTLDGATAFFKCLKIYPKKDELIAMLDKTMPKDVIEVLAKMIAIDDLGLGLDP